MRRGSLVGPLLLIAIGAWLLINTIRPDLHMFDIAARYWPWVLVAWGGLRILEILVWKMRGRPVPQAGISGGEWAVVIFLCFAGSGLYAVNQFSSGKLGFIRANRVEIFGRSFDFPVAEKRVAAPKDPRILVENLRGGLRITAADVKEVVIGGRRTVRALNENDANAANGKSEVEAAAQGDQIVVRTNEERISGEERVTTDLEVTVPQTASIEYRGRDGEVEIDGVSGPVEISSDHATVRLRNLGGNARVDVRDAKLLRAVNLKGNLELIGGHGGDIELDTIAGEVTINGSYSGDLEFRNLAKPIRLQGPNAELRVEKVPGEIHMDLDKFSATNLVGPIRLASTRSRDVQLEQFTQALDLSVRGGDITLRPAEAAMPKIDARTRDGNVELILPGSAKFSLKAVSNRGEVTNEYGEPLKTDERSGDNHERSRAAITGGTGQGPEILIETERGSITVRKDTGAALASQHEQHRQRADRWPERPPSPPAPPAPPEVETH